MALDRQHCCEEMTSAVQETCEKHADRFDCADCLIDYNAKIREYGIMIHDGGMSILVITFCPWCGTRLPESQRERWYAELRRRGVDPWTDDLPEEFTDDRWLESS